MHYTCIACITIDSVMRMKKKELSASLFEECKYKIKKKKKKMTNFIKVELESESESEFDTESELKSNLESD